MSMKWEMKDAMKDAMKWAYQAAILWLSIIGHGLPVPMAIDPAPPQPQPFLNFRDVTLAYHGSSVDLTNLTELRVGWFGPTNLNDPLTGDLWWAANHAIDEANAQHARFSVSEAADGRSEGMLPFRLVPAWAANPWGTGVSRLVRMIYEEEPLVVIGSVDSATTHLAEQIVAKANLPLVSPISTDPSVTMAGVSWMFSCAPSDAAIAPVLVNDVLATVAGQDRLILLVTADHESRMVAGEMLKEFGRRGRLPDYRFTVPTGAQDVSQQIAALVAASPAAVLIIAGVEDAARLVIAVRKELPLRDGPCPCHIFGTQAMGRARFLELAGSASEGARFPLLFVPDNRDFEQASFMARFTTERGRRPDYTAMFTYDATRLVIEAIRRAGPNRARIRETLAEPALLANVPGMIQFDGTGQNRCSAIAMGMIRDGQVVRRNGNPPIALRTGTTIQHKIASSGRSSGWWSSHTRTVRFHDL
jgi:branched-chain amino acid transport system substrate-binding protein